MAIQIQIYINSDDTSDKDIIEINIQNSYQLTSSMNPQMQNSVNDIIAYAVGQWTQDCSDALHPEKPQTPFGNAIHDNEF